LRRIQPFADLAGGVCSGRVAHWYDVPRWSAA
jgi:hypothetical protein